MKFEKLATEILSPMSDVDHAIRGMFLYVSHFGSNHEKEKFMVWLSDNMVINVLNTAITKPEDHFNCCNKLSWSDIEGYYVLSQYWFDVEYVDTIPYGNFNHGKPIQNGSYQKVAYWIGRNFITVGRKYYYFYIAGSMYVGNSLGFAKNVFRVPIDELKMPINIIKKHIDTLNWEQERFFLINQNVNFFLI